MRQVPDGPMARRRVTFRNPKAEMSSKGDVEDYSSWNPLSQIGDVVGVASPTAGHPHLVDRTQGNSGDKRPQKLTWKIRASFYIPKVRMMSPTRTRIYCSPLPRSLNRNAFLPDKLSYQDMQQQLVLLDDCLCQELQYWAEKQKSAEKPGSPSFSWKCC